MTKPIGVPRDFWANNSDDLKRYAAMRRSGCVISFDDDDRFVPICLIRDYGDVDCVAVYYSGEFVRQILDHPDRVRVSNPEGDGFHIEAVAVAAGGLVDGDGVMIAVCKNKV